MNIKEFPQKTRDFVIVKKEQFIELPKKKKIIFATAFITLILAGLFAMSYAKANKYSVLFSGLDPNDATAVTKDLESRKVETKIKGDSILVPKGDVDKLRMELSNNISNGSKGFEIMDSGSSFGMTDEEFLIKKQRMIQGEIEKTIKVFPQVQGARVHITQGEESVFANETVPGKAAVYLELKPGQNLKPDQVISIMSLVSASTQNIPKQNVEVIDQNMKLLSDGLIDDKGNVHTNSLSEVDEAMKAQKDLGKDLERSILGLLEPIFGQGNIKASVNADLNFDSSEKTEIIIDPNKVITKESKSTSKSSKRENTGGPVDNNMNNLSQNGQGTDEDTQQEIEYNTGKTETKTIQAKGGINKITASVAINGTLTSAELRNVEDMVANAVGMQAKRGDSIKVVSMGFGSEKEDNSTFGVIKSAISKDKSLGTVLIIAGVLSVIILLLLIGTIIHMIIKKKKETSELAYVDEEDEVELINRKLEELEKNRLNSNEEEDEESISLEDEVKQFAAENPDQVTDLVNSWLNE
ncbi:flagellar basal-body MS-ring/collar protein FliF [Paraclostridium ghonii]|uniref:flagellar basal-body MS-ring/collar protein FliF n=1 Tax=Paraclostridium ghonii TaxID=29358 RepID=UPI00202D0CCA|nr:flagellar basal-body MS-ring/collar protein FliF [Paeniclostridium ghonii]MCM0165130.1 flagellar M-ring protein FliF [Paeniclostridium ghonii]